MLVVGLTGGIASGKSTVSKILGERHRLPIVDADVLARQVLDPGTSGFDLVVKHFGPDRVLRPDGTLDRAAIGDIVFHDPDERRWLNGVVHPRVRREMVKGVIKAWLSGEWCVILDVPLLIEAGIWRWVGDVTVVYVNDKLQLSRLLDRQSNPPLTPAQAHARISSQLALSEKVNYGTSILDNSGTLQDLTAQVDRLVEKWRKQQGGASGWWWKVCWLVPPVGLVAGLLVVLRSWMRSKGRRRSRGEKAKELSRRSGRAEGERIELRDMNGQPRQRGTSSGSSILEE